MSAPNPAPNVKAPKGYRATQLPKFTPAGENLYNDLIARAAPGAGNAVDYLSRLASGDEDIFKQIEAPAFTNFDKILGQIGSTYSQFGARDSSAFQNAVSGAGAEMAQSLAADRNRLTQDAINKLLGLSTSLMQTNPYETVLTQKERDTAGPDWMKLLGQFGPAIIGLLTGNPAAAATAIPGIMGSMGGNAAQTGGNQIGRR